MTRLDTPPEKTVKRSFEIPRERFADPEFGDALRDNLSKIFPGALVAIDKRAESPRLNHEAVTVEIQLKMGSNQEALPLLAALDTQMLAYAGGKMAFRR